MSDFEYRFSIVSETPSTLTVKHVKYGVHTIATGVGENCYSVISHGSNTLNTFEITTSGNVVIKNLEIFKNSEKYMMIIYQFINNGTVVNPQIEKIKLESLSQLACYTLLSKLPFTSVNIKNSDSLIIRFGIEWKNFEKIQENFQDKLSNARFKYNSTRS